MKEIKIHCKFTDYGCDAEGNVYSVKSGKWKRLKPCKTKDGYLQFQICENGKVVRQPYVHQFIFECFNIEKPEDLPVYSTKTGNGLTIDHIEDKTDNRPCNLRLMTHAENVSRNINRRKNSENKGNNKHKHIYWHKRDNKFKLQISIDGKFKHFGYFKSIEEALEEREKIYKKYNIHLT